MPSKLLISAAVAAGFFALVGGRRQREARGTATINHIFTEQFDPIFRQVCSGIPRAYLRALAKHESDFNPLDDSGPAHGLLQVVEVVREGYNERFGTNFSRVDLLDPSINALIACELITRIARVLPANHPRAIPNPSFRDPRFVGLVTLAWNAGFSEAAGMGFVLGKMVDAGFSPQDINIDSVHKFSLSLPDNKGKFLKMPGRVEFARRVVRDYMRQVLEV